MNKSGDQNRGVRNTKKRLLTGLLSLMREKTISNITVRELVELVDVNRGTFYFHYSDIHDMVSKVQDESFQDFNDIIGQKIDDPTEGKPLDIFVEIYSFCAENRDFCEVMLGPNGDIAFVERIKKIASDRICDFLTSKGHYLSREENEYLNAFIINGYIGILQKWLKNGCKQSPEEVAMITSNVIIPATKNLISPSSASPNLTMFPHPQKRLLSKGAVGAAD